MVNIAGSIRKGNGIWWSFHAGNIVPTPFYGRKCRGLWSVLGDRYGGHFFWSPLLEKDFGRLTKLLLRTSIGKSPSKEKPWKEWSYDAAKGFEGLNPCSSNFLHHDPDGIYFASDIGRASLGKGFTSPSILELWSRWIRFSPLLQIHMLNIKALCGCCDSNEIAITNLIFPKRLRAFFGIKNGTFYWYFFSTDLILRGHRIFQWRIEARMSRHEGDGLLKSAPISAVISLMMPFFWLS